MFEPTSQFHVMQNVGMLPFQKVDIWNTMTVFSESASLLLSLAFIKKLLQFALRTNVEIIHSGVTLRWHL